MASARDTLRQILSGGLPAVLDFGPSAGSTQGDNTAVEKTPPAATIQSVEPIVSFQSRLLGLSSQQILTGTLAVVAVIGAVALLRR